MGKGRLAVALAFMIGTAPAVATEPAKAPAQRSTRGPVTNLPLPRFVSLRVETANVRRGPSLDQRIDWEFVHRGLPLEITAEYGQWRRVRDADGATGWVHHTLLSGVRTALVQADAPVPLLATPHEDGLVRAMAEPGAIARLEQCQDAWCEIEAGGAAGWLPRGTIWGVGPDETVE